MLKRKGFFWVSIKNECTIYYLNNNIFHLYILTFYSNLFFGQIMLLTLDLEVFLNYFQIYFRVQNLFLDPDFLHHQPNPRISLAPFALVCRYSYIFTYMCLYTHTHWSNYIHTGKESKGYLMKLTKPLQNRHLPMLFKSFFNNIFLFHGFCQLDCVLRGFEKM